MNLPPLSLYVHLPWCVKKCPYCDFNSYGTGKAAPKGRYITALLNDIRGESRKADGRVIQSVFLGGGTPSLFAPSEIEDLLKGVRALFVLAEDVEITMEVNPGTVECGSPGGYRDAGVNRLSIGAQTFDNQLLRILGRIHSGRDITRTVQGAREAGFENINIDLMHSLPEQTVEMALADLRAAIELNPEHISWYQLTLEPNTIIPARPPANLPDDDLEVEIQDPGQALLAERGYEQYEVSAYARDGLRCRHNMNYWLFGDYLAAGAGAHGKLTSAGGVGRYQKPANPRQYMRMQEDPKAGVDLAILGQADLVFEFMLNALRLNSGFAEEIFVERTGLTVSDLADTTLAAREKGLIERSEAGFWRPTDLGRRFLDDLQSEFIVDQP